MKVVKLEDCINEIKSLDNNGVITRSVNHICEDMRKEVKEFDAIPISENMTNEDTIKAMFSNATFMIGEEKDEQGTKNLYVYTDDFEGFAVDLDWWNAPYKKEVEE